MTTGAPTAPAGEAAPSPEPMNGMPTVPPPHAAMRPVKAMTDSVRVSSVMAHSQEVEGAVRERTVQNSEGPGRPLSTLHASGSGAPSERLRLLRAAQDRKSTRLNSSHGYISYAVFCLKKKKKMWSL